jgi:hypothetical protein
MSQTHFKQKHALATRQLLFEKKEVSQRQEREIPIHKYLGTYDLVSIALAIHLESTLLSGERE